MRFAPMTFRPSGRVIATGGFPAITADHTAIADYQRILMGLGFDVGPRHADGMWGDATSRAVRNFQTWHNGEGGSRLVVDGLLGPATQAALLPYINRTADRPVAQVPVVVGPAPAPSPAVAGATPVAATWGARGFMDLTLAPSIGAPASGGTSPWVVLATIAGLSTAAVALARYLDDRRSKR